MSNILISEELEWMREYIYSIKHIIPTFEKLHKIVARKPRIYNKNIQRTVGHCYIYRGKCHIVIQTRRKNNETMDTFKVRHFTKIELLVTLAHELAHMVHWDHTPEHKELECRLASIFMRRLKKNGYKSEEAEEKELPRKFSV